MMTEQETGERSLSGRGRPPIKLAFTPVRELTEEDLVKLHSADLGSTSPPLKKIREAHHNLARLLSDGVSNEEAGRICGFSPSRVSILRNDPALADLISYYNSHKDEINADMTLQFNAVLLSSLQTLQERILENPEEVSTSALITTITSLMDRTGFGPTTKILSASLTLGANDIIALKKAATERTIGNVNIAQPDTIEHSPAETKEPEENKENSQKHGGSKDPRDPKSIEFVRHKTLPANIQGAEDTQPNGSNDRDLPIEVPVKEKEESYSRRERSYLREAVQADTDR